MYTAVYTLAAVCMFVYTAVNMLAADGAVFTHLYSPPPSSAVSQRSEHAYLIYLGPSFRHS